MYSLRTLPSIKDDSLHISSYNLQLLLLQKSPYIVVVLLTNLKSLDMVVVLLENLKSPDMVVVLLAYLKNQDMVDVLLVHKKSIYGCCHANIFKNSR